jgi:hypothetical protein
MLEFGFYKHVMEINELLDPLLSLLNGTSDVTSKEQVEKKLIDRISSPTKKKKPVVKKTGTSMRLTSRYEETEDNITVHKSKEVVCQIMETIINIRDDKRVTNLLLKFRKQMDNEGDYNQGNGMKIGGSINKSKRSIYTKLLGFY